MSGLKERLGRLRQTTATVHAEREPVGGARSASGEEKHRADARRLHPAFVRIGVREVCTEEGSFLLREVRYPLPHRHGRYRLGELAECAPHLWPLGERRRNVGQAREPEAAHSLNAGGLLFLDTETTGLGVGAGNLPFMIGLGRLTAEGLIVRQSLIRHPGEERAMLIWLSEQFQGVTHIATYNGKSFDWPLLENRFILNGWRRKGPAPGHLDFLHPSRALWKNTLPTCRLGTVEELRLDVVRDDDVPGSLAPELYMRFLQDSDPEHLHGVFKHNELDVLSLVALAIHFGRLLGGAAEADVFASTAASMGREERFRTAIWLERQGRIEAARQIYDMLSLEATAGFDGRNAEWLLALAAKCKRLGQWDRALPLWELAAGHAETARLPGVTAHLELAIYYEHRVRDCASALRYAEQGLALSTRREVATRATDTAREARAMWERRIERLQRKLSVRRFDWAECEEIVSISKKG